MWWLLVRVRQAPYQHTSTTLDTRQAGHNGHHNPTQATMPRLRPTCDNGPTGGDTGVLLPHLMTAYGMAVPQHHQAVCQCLTRNDPP
jgi:hypothetical protein